MGSAPHEKPCAHCTLFVVSLFLDLFCTLQRLQVSALTEKNGREGRKKKKNTPSRQQRLLGDERSRPA